MTVMRYRRIRNVLLAVVVWFPLLLSEPTWAQTARDSIKHDYLTATSALQKHIEDDFWIDDAPASPELLRRHWFTAGEWVAAWLNEHPQAGAEGVRTAIQELVPEDANPKYLKLTDEAYLVAAPGALGNAFVVARMSGRYRLARSTAQIQAATGKQADILAAWRPENARHGRRGPYWAASGSAGTVEPTEFAMLPRDAEGRVRFYIEGAYAQSAGGTMGAQISLWSWDGTVARPLLARDFAVVVDQSVGTRLEGDLLKVQQKKFFRTFSSCGQCEERQTDWTVRITPEGVEDLGETSMVPELDAVDELFFRLVHQKPATDIASPRAISEAEKIVKSGRRGQSEKEWRENPWLGMMGKWTVNGNLSNKVLCLFLDSLYDPGAHLFKMKSTGGALFLTDVVETKQACQ